MPPPDPSLRPRQQHMVSPGAALTLYTRGQATPPGAQIPLARSRAGQVPPARSRRPGQGVADGAGEAVGDGEAPGGCFAGTPVPPLAACRAWSIAPFTLR